MKNNNKYKELLKINERTHAIRTKKITEMASTIKAFYNEQFLKIQSNKEISSLGKRSRVHELKLNIAYEAVSYANDAKTEYIKLAAKAIELSKAIKAEELTPPSDVDKKLFEDDFAKLKLDVALAITPEKAIEQLKLFAEQYAEPFYAAKVLEGFEQIVTNILAISNSPHIRVTLAKVKEGYEAIAITPAIEAANNALVQYADAEKVKLFRSETIQFKAIREVLDGFASSLLAEDYAAELEKIDVQIAEFVAKGGNN